MKFLKKRDQAGHIWDSSKGAKDKDGNPTGAVAISFEKQARDEQGVDGFYDTKKKSEIKLLKDMGYEYDESDEQEGMPLDTMEGEKEG